MTSSVVHVPFSGIRVTIKSAQPFDETDGKIRKGLKAETFIPGHPFHTNPSPYYAKGDVKGFEHIVEERTGPYGFMLFDMLAHDEWLPLYASKPHTVHISHYTIGNPLLAQTMLTHDYLACLHVPLRVCVLESEEQPGTSSITYVLPSSQIAIGALKNAEEEEKLKAAATALDEKVGGFLRSVGGVEV